MKIDPNGPVYPQQYRVSGSASIVGQSGMTIRTWLAGQAMKGIIANDCLMHELADCAGREYGPLRQLMAVNAVYYADALIEELNRTETTP